MPQVKEHVNAQPKTATALADRVATLESELATLKATVSVLIRQYNKPMLDTFGSMPDNETSREAERLGRAYRDRQPKC
jgi:hypothetical protein